MELKKEVIEIMEAGGHQMLDERIRWRMLDKGGVGLQDNYLHIKALKRIKAMVTEHAEYLMGRV